MIAIKGFQGEYRWLSNFWPCRVIYKGIQFPSVENAYVWAKRGHKEEDLEILKIIPSNKAKLFGKIDTDYVWHQTKRDVMYELLKSKFTINLELQEKLLATDNQDIFELNNWKDMYWGVNMIDGKMVGHNHLGQLLMLIRMNLRGEGLV